MIDISVIIPTYKPGEYLWECLESLYGQTLDKSKYEIILILNGCDEPWKSKINSWINEHPGMIVQNLCTLKPGVSNARNIGIQHIRGNYVAFIDDDDYVSNTYLSDLLANANNKTVVLSDSISFCDGTNIFDGNYPQHLTYKYLCTLERISLFQARSIFNGPCMKLIPSEYVRDKYFDTSIMPGEDSLFMLNVSQNISNIVLADSGAVYYRRIRQNSATTTHRKRCELFFNLCRALTRYTTLFIKNPTKYNILFLMSRYAAGIKTFIIS